MKISTQTLQAAVHNTHVEMHEEELSACRAEMEFVVDWAQEMDTLPLDNLHPTVAVNLPDNCPTRPDVATPSLGSPGALAQANAKLGSCFLVPQILE